MQVRDDGLAAERRDRHPKPPPQVQDVRRDYDDAPKAPIGDDMSLHVVDFSPDNDAELIEARDAVQRLLMQAAEHARDVGATDILVIIPSGAGAKSFGATSNAHELVGILEQQKLRLLLGG